MVSLEPANNPEYEEQGTIRLLKGQLSEGSPQGADSMGNHSPSCDNPLGKTPHCHNAS